MKKLLVVALLAVSASVPAQASSYLKNRDMFVDANTGYVVTTKTLGSRMIVSGKHPVTGSTFRLMVQPSGKVAGTYENNPIAFSVNDRNAGSQLASGGSAAAAE